MVLDTILLAIIAAYTHHSIRKFRNFAIKIIRLLNHLKRAIFGMEQVECNKVDEVLVIIVRED